MHLKKFYNHAAIFKANEIGLFTIYFRLYMHVNVMDMHFCFNKCKNKKVNKGRLFVSNHPITLNTVIAAKNIYGAYKCCHMFVG